MKKSFQWSVFGCLLSVVGFQLSVYNQVGNDSGLFQLVVCHSVGISKGFILFLTSTDKYPLPKLQYHCLRKVEIQFRWAIFYTMLVLQIYEYRKFFG